MKMHRFILPAAKLLVSALTLGSVALGALTGNALAADATKASVVMGRGGNTNQLTTAQLGKGNTNLAQAITAACKQVGGDTVVLNMNGVATEYACTDGSVITGRKAYTSNSALAGTSGIKNASDTGIVSKNYKEPLNRSAITAKVNAQYGNGLTPGS